MRIDSTRMNSLSPQPASSFDRQRCGAWFLLALAAYFVLHIAVRVTLTDSLAMDEAEQALAFSHLQLGYGTQPPLYTWLQWGMFTLFGFNVFALALLKNLILFSLYAGVFFIARPLIGIGGAMAASASMIFIPEIAWESQRDLTHTVLLTAIACATLWCYFRMLQKPSWTRYALFGLLIGLGLLSKYNFTVFIGGLACASLLVPEHRAIIWNRKMAIAAVIALLCILPHGLWLLHNVDAASSGTLEKMREGARPSYAHNLLRGFGSMMFGMLDFLTPLWLIYAVIGRRYFRHATIDRHSPTARFFIWLYIVFFLLMGVILVSGHISNIKGRWLQHLLFFLPLIFFVMLPTLRCAVVYRNILRMAAVFAALILLAIPLRVQVGPLLHKYSRSHHPYPQLAEELAHRFPQANALVVGEKLATGNLYFQRPAMPTFNLDRLLGQHADLHDEVLFVTPDAVGDGQLQHLLDAYPGSIVEKQGKLLVPYQKGRGDMMAFDYALIKVGNR